MTSKTTLTALTLAAIMGVAAYTALPAGAQDSGMGMGDNARMPPFETVDADKDGKITAAEIAAHRKATVLGSDTNGDGKLSAEELTARQVRQMTERFQLPYPVVPIDEATQRAWKATSLPSTFILRPDGTVAWSVRGAIEGRELDDALQDITR